MSHVVDVVMPVYNAALYLPFSIESILQQTFTDFRFIIIDDWSTDESRDIIQQYAQKDARIMPIRNEKNSWICISLNTWIAASNAPYIVRMDADDISHRDRIEKQVAFMEHHPGVWVSGCSTHCIDQNGVVSLTKHYPLTDSNIRKTIFFFTPIPHPWAIIRREIFNQTTGYNSHYILAEDLDLWFQIGTKSELANMPDILLDYRIYSTNSTHTKFKQMISQAIKVRHNAIRSYGYKPSWMWYIAIYVTYVIQLFPIGFINWLFYRLRSLIS